MSPLYVTLLVVFGLFTASTIAAWIEMLVASGKNPLKGLIIPSILFILAISASVTMGVLKGSLLPAIYTLLLMNIPLCITLFVFILKRRTIYLEKLELYRQQNKKLPKSVSIPEKTLSRIHAFGGVDSLSLSAEAQRDILIRVKSGMSVRNITTISKCSESAVALLASSFDAFCEDEDKKESGVDYTFSKTQKELFLQQMITSSPRALGAGTSLLWSRDALRELFSDTLNMNISLASVDEFLYTCKLFIPSELTVTEKMKDEEFKKWTDEHFDKIRLRSIEKGCAIAFVYAIPISHEVTGKRMTMLASLTKKGEISFGVYKGDGGYKDFTDKLLQENENKIFIILTQKEAFPKFSLAFSSAGEAELFCVTQSER